MVKRMVPGSQYQRVAHMPRSIDFKRNFDPVFYTLSFRILRINRMLVNKLLERRMSTGKFRRHIYLLNIVNTGPECFISYNNSTIAIQLLIYGIVFYHFNFTASCNFFRVIILFAIIYLFRLDFRFALQ